MFPFDDVIMNVNVFKWSAWICALTITHSEWRLELTFGIFINSLMRHQANFLSNAGKAYQMAFNRHVLINTCELSHEQLWSTYIIKILQEITDIAGNISSFWLDKITQDSWLGSSTHLAATAPVDSKLEISHYIDVIMTTMASEITSLTVVYSTIYSDTNQRKHKSSASLAFVWGIHRDRWIPRTKGQ